jgi:hypothetical protein
MNLKPEITRRGPKQSSSPLGKLQDRREAHEAKATQMERNRLDPTRSLDDLAKGRATTASARPWCIHAHCCISHIRWQRLDIVASPLVTRSIAPQ